MSDRPSLPPHTSVTACNCDLPLYHYGACKWVVWNILARYAQEIDMTIPDASMVVHNPLLPKK